MRDPFGSREELLSTQLIHLATTGQPCDIATRSGQRFIGVTIDDTIFVKLISGLGDSKLTEELSEIRLKKGRQNVGVVNFNDIWIINPIPKEGLTDEDLENVDISQGEATVLETGDTLRDAIRKSFHCENESEVDYFLRRFLAS